MRAFEIDVNGRRLCVAGIADSGVLSAMLTSVTERGRNDLNLHVAGLVNPTEEHLIWRDLRLKVGDEVRVTVTDTESVDKARQQHRRDRAEELRSQKHYVRQMAKKLGWVITTQRSKSN
jgi:hypothetical protein